MNNFNIKKVKALVEKYDELQKNVMKFGKKHKRKIHLKENKNIILLMD